MRIKYPTAINRQCPQYCYNYHMRLLAEHLAEFKAEGLTIFPKMMDAAWVAQMRDCFDEIGDRVITSDGTRASVFTDVLEHKPDLVLPALTNPRLLDFAEMLVGPHVQLESITYSRSPPDTGTPSPVLGFHRDLFAFYPQEGVYHRPLLFNAITYLQDLTDQTGPLRVVPRSHMRTIGVTEEEMMQPHPEEILVYPKAGDLLVFHNSLLHSGTINLSSDYRYLFFLTLQHSWLKQRANYTGPVSQGVIARARERGDRRLMRLLGVDDQFLRRANCGFREPDEASWSKWIVEDASALDQVNLKT